MARREFSTRIKRTAWDRASGKCESCGAPLTIGRFHYDHDLPCGLGGEPTLDNCRVLCVACHTEKTGSRDIPAMRKADRMKSRHIGAHQSRSPLPCGRSSKFKKRMDGTVVLRDPPTTRRPSCDPTRGVLTGETTARTPRVGSLLNKRRMSMSKAVLVTTEYRGVFFGYADSTEGDTITLKKARNCIYWPSSQGGFMGLAAEGPAKGARIGSRADIELRKITSVVEVSPQAVEKWEAADVYRG